MVFGKFDNLVEEDAGNEIIVINEAKGLGGESGLGSWVEQGA